MNKEKWSRFFRLLSVSWSTAYTLCDIYLLIIGTWGAWYIVNIVLAVFYILTFPVVLFKAYNKETNSATKKILIYFPVMAWIGIFLKDKESEMTNDFKNKELKITNNSNGQ